jgi:hypothetical protein
MTVLDGWAAVEDYAAAAMQMFLAPGFKHFFEFGIKKNGIPPVKGLGFLPTRINRSCFIRQLRRA